MTKSYPKEETFGLVSQMRRSSSAIPANIAEGCGRYTKSELRRFLIYAIGSSSESEYQFFSSRDLNYITDKIFKELEKDVTEIRKVIHSFMIKISQDQ